MKNVECGMCGRVVAKLVKGSAIRNGAMMHCGECIERCREMVKPKGISIFNAAAMKEAELLNDEGE